MKESQVMDNHLILNPKEIMHPQGINDTEMIDMQIFHNTDCFQQTKLFSPLISAKKRIKLLQKPQKKEPKIKLRKITHRISLSAHDLDFFEFDTQTLLSTKDKHWPSPKEFGIIFHRFIEIGIANPALDDSNLSSEWLVSNPDLLTDPSTIEMVLKESNLVDKKVIENTKKRLNLLGKKLRKGMLGQLATGKLVNSMRVQGLRTELPFFIRFDMEFSDIIRKKWTPSGEVPVSSVNKIQAQFEGRADLVIALIDENGNKWLQVVDIKTTGSLYGFNSENFELGTILQKTESDLMAIHAISQAEKKLLQQHRFQLALYSLALEQSEMMKPEHLRRKILPPAILVAASGRLFRMDLSMYEKALQDLHLLIEKRAKASAKGENTHLSNDFAEKHNI
jgi:hypothetical protein